LLSRAFKAAVSEVNRFTLGFTFICPACQKSMIKSNPPSLLMMIKLAFSCVLLS
jgi:hypothetical protein